MASPFDCLVPAGYRFKVNDYFVLKYFTEETIMYSTQITTTKIIQWIKLSHQLKFNPKIIIYRN